MFIHFLFREGMEYAISSLICLLNASICGNKLLSEKFVTKFLYILEFGTQRDNIVKFLQEHGHKIRHSFWLPFLPLLVSHLHNLLLKEEESISSKILMDIIHEVLMAYPQQMFILIHHLKDIIKSEVVSSG